jgi:CRISPR-associated protein Csb2
MHQEPLFGASAVWESARPFVVTRYPKCRGAKRDHPAAYATPQALARQVMTQELNRLRERRPDLPDVVAIKPFEGLGPSGGWRAIQFQRFRRKRDDDGGRRPNGAFRIEFTAPVHGPLCLGHSCHFGLGLFRPILATNDKRAAR